MAAASAASWSIGAQAYASDQSGGPFVERGRISWITRSGVPDADGRIARQRYVLRSRSMSGRSPTALVVPVDRLSGPGPAFSQFMASFVRVNDGRLVVQGSWQTPLDPGSGAGPDVSDQGVVGVFDARTGGLLSQVPVGRTGPTDPFLVPGTPAVLVSGSRGDAEQPLVDALGLRVFGARAAGLDTTVKDDVVGAYVGDNGLSGSGPWWRRGRGRFVVRDLATGRERYALRAAELRTAARAPASADVFVELQRGGSLLVIVQRRQGTAAGLRPVWVDASGRVRALPAVPGATSVSAVSRFERVLVGIERYAGRGSAAPRCFAEWITDRAARRTRRLTATDPDGFVRTTSPVHWDERYMVSVTSKDRGPGRNGGVGVRVDERLQDLPLRRGLPVGCVLRRP